MKIIERSVIRLAAVQHLRTAYGIKIKNWNKNKARNSFKVTSSNSVKVFGVPLESLPHYNVDHGSVPCILMDACRSLQEHVDTEGLFRKSGSVVRLKALRAKLDSGEDCLSTALPCDVAGMVKQFFRELPDPALPIELHDALLKAQQLPTEEERTSATLLLSCVLPDPNMSILRYFFGFLHKVSQRSAVNKMDSSNLSVIFAPNLLHSGDGADKMNASTEKRLRQQAAVVYCFIENASDFGVAPQHIMEKIPALLGCDGSVLSPTIDGPEQFEANSGVKRRCRRSLGDMVSGALIKLKTNRTPTNTPLSDRCVFSSTTPVVVTPSSKRKLPLESGQSYGFSSKKRRSIKNNLGFDLLPNALFGGSSTPRPGQLDPSASESLDLSQNAQASVGRTNRQSASSARRKSKRLSHRHAVNRVESGKAGCFSPKAAKKENVGKSLRLRFSLGKNRDSREGSMSIGWRLATQESTTSFRLTKDAEFSPDVLRNKNASKGSKMYSKSEDNLLTPQSDSVAFQTSWSEETPNEGHVYSRGSFTDTPLSLCLKNNYCSEPAIVVAKPPMLASFPKKRSCTSSTANLDTEGSFSQTLTLPTMLTVRRAMPSEGSGSTLQRVPGDHSAPSGEDKSIQPEMSQTDSASLKCCPLATASPNKETSSMPTPLKYGDHDITFGQIEFVPLSPLHIDSSLFEVGGCVSLSGKACDRSLCAAERSVGGDVETVTEQANCSRLIDALDIQSPAHFTRSVTIQSTPYKVSGLDYCQEPRSPLPTMRVMLPDDDDDEEDAVASPERSTCPRVQPQQAPSPSTVETRRGRVADHIQRFNKLTIYSPKSQVKAVKSPLKFQRTPVRHSVCRINSMLGERGHSQAGESSSQRRGTAPNMGKAVSLESGLSSTAQLQPLQSRHADDQAGLSPDRKTKNLPPPVPPKRLASVFRKPCALGDVTNKFPPKVPGEQQFSERKVCHYRGSPRNPLHQGRLLSATKPIDL
ncbi:hypothetical protein UPYG_G00223390 [Umbra pygmaea]|uniref:Rho-GAP domain-containing protein n=1 Tax=Umbra pygmaea TaxID=75934 RepID=A0ABD0WH06_UMBPY